MPSSRGSPTCCTQDRSAKIADDCLSHIHPVSRRPFWLCASRRAVTVTPKTNNNHRRVQCVVEGNSSRCLLRVLFRLVPLRVCECESPGSSGHIRDFSDSSYQFVALIRNLKTRLSRSLRAKKKAAKRKHNGHRCKRVQ